MPWMGGEDVKGEKRLRGDTRSLQVKIHRDEKFLRERGYKNGREEGRNKRESKSRIPSEQSAPCAEAEGKKS